MTCHLTRQKSLKFFLIVAGIMNKAPGPNGMTMTLIQSKHNTVRTDVMTIFIKFSLGNFVASVNATFIGPFPTKENAENIRGCQFISFVGCIYKLLSKL